MSFAKQAAITGGTNGGIAILGLVTGTLAARMLGPTGRGELAAIQTWAVFLGALATLGLSEAVVLFCARGPERAGRYITSALVLGLIGCLPILLLGYLLMPLLLSAQTPQIVHAARWYLAIAIVYVITGAPYGGLRSLRDLTPWNAIRLLPGVIWISVLVFSWVMGKATPSFLALLNLVGLAAIGLPITLWAVRRQIKGSYQLDPKLWPPLLRFGLPSIGSSLPQTLNLRFDQMLMAALLPARLLGLYVVAVAWSGMISPMLHAIAVVLFPHMASHGSKEEQSRAFVRVVALASPLAFISSIGIALITPWALPLLFGHSFSDGVPSALVLILANAVLNIGQLLEEGFRGFGKPMAILWAESGGLIVTAVALISMLKPMGIMGAALSSLLGYTSVCILLLIQARSETGSSITAILWPSRSEVRASWARLRQFSWTS